jgi:hypothetical protein
VRASRKTVLILVLGILLSLSIAVSGSAHAAQSIKGRVEDEEGNPVAGVEVSTWFKNTLETTNVTGPEGLFEISTGDEIEYDVIFFANDSSTPGVDYLPVRAKVRPSDLERLDVTLLPAASLILEGDIQYVESEELPISIFFSVIDPDTGKVMEHGGFPLIYGVTEESWSLFLDLEHNHVVAPADGQFGVKANVSILIGTGVEVKSFDMEESRHLSLDAGSRLTLDVRQYSVRHNLDISESFLDTVKTKLDEVEAFGFYVAVERKVTGSAERWLTEAEALFEEGRYVESFDACKRGFIDLRHTLFQLNAMLIDASYSVYIIIAFLALSSVTISFLLSNTDLYKTLGSATVYTCTLLVLYFSYPGSVIVPLELFIEAALISISVSLVFAIIFPRFLKGRERDGHVPVRNIVVPIFSMAKRSIKRRRLRFTLTLVSITVLVMSFVSLTSFSEGYGLIVNRVSNRAYIADGVLLRASGYTETEPTEISEKELASGWLERQPESLSVSAKAESYPLKRSLASIAGHPIWGILGFEPTAEVALAGVENVLLEGSLPSEGGIAISEELRGALGAEIGDTITFNWKDYTLEGVFDDEAVFSLRELEGSSYLPGKWVNIDPSGDVPQYVLEPCEPSEVVVLHISKALMMPLTGITRITVTVSMDVDVDVFAERLALERGYWAFSGSADGVLFSRLGSYLEGKGLPLLVPWVIVVLNVVITMLNSMYERRKEIHILSSVGINPAQIAAIFVAEAIIIGLTAGGAGYLLGLGIYKGMALLSLTLEVRQKISAFWSLASIGIAMTAVLMGAFAALRSSVVITPSLMRRWRIEERKMGLFEPFDILIPVRLLPEEIDDFVTFVEQELHKQEDGFERMTSSIKLIEKPEDAVRRLDFVYKSPGTVSGNFYTKNNLVIERTAEGDVVVRLISFGEKEWAHVTGSMVRMLGVRWSLT